MLKSQRILLLDSVHIILPTTRAGHRTGRIMSYASPNYEVCLSPISKHDQVKYESYSNIKFTWSPMYTLLHCRGCRRLVTSVTKEYRPWNKSTNEGYHEYFIQLSIPCTWIAIPSPPPSVDKRKPRPKTTKNATSGSLPHATMTADGSKPSPLIPLPPPGAANASLVGAAAFSETGNRMPRSACWR